MNPKNERIKKLFLRGVTDPAKIARKLGLPNTERVNDGIQWLLDHGEIQVVKEGEK